MDDYTCSSNNNLVELLENNIDDPMRNGRECITMQPRALGMIQNSVKTNICLRLQMYCNKSAEL